LRKQQVSLKQKTKATLRRWGVLSVEGQRVYSKEGRKDCLGRLDQPEVTAQLKGLYRMLDLALETQSEAKAQMKRLGSQYSEIGEFQEMPGIGPIGAHLSGAIVQTPHRFATKQKLWSYSGLGIRNQTSDGKPLGYEKLDSKGRTELKALSYRAWRSAIRHSPNEVATFFEESVSRTGDRTHARLNTQRKILATLLSLWKHNSTYRPKRFLGSA
jgi:transposase